MKPLIKPILTFLCALFVTVEGYSQCSGATCNANYSTSSAAAITVPAGQTYCITAPSGNITFSGTITVDGTLCVYANNGNISFTGSIILHAGGIINTYSAGTYKVIMDGYFDTFANPATGARYLNNYGTLNIDYNNAGSSVSGWRIYKSTKVTNYSTGTLAVKYDIDASDALIDNRGTMTVGGYIKALSDTDITNSGTLNVTGRVAFTARNFTNNGTMTVGGDLTSGSSSIYTNGGNLSVTGNVNWVGDAMTNTGPLSMTGNLMTAGLPFINSAPLNIGGNWSMNTNLVLTNTAPINVTGDLTFYGDYTQSSTVTVGGLLTFNAGSVGDISGGRFYSKTLIFNAAQVTSTGSSCAAFITNGTTAVQNGSFRATGNVAVIDRSDPGMLDTNNCPATPVNCGLKLAASEASSVCPNPTLPVSLISFKGKYLSEDHVELLWTTASEENNKQFIIERTEDLKTFTQVGLVKGAGNSRENTNYRYIDNQVGSPEIYYRLSQQDINGTKQNLGFILPDRPDGEFVVEVFPNPNKGQFKIAAFGDYKIYHIHLLDQTGKLVYAVNDINSNLEKTFDVHLEGLKGMYILEVGTGESMFYNKIHIE